MRHLVALSLATLAVACGGGGSKPPPRPEPAALTVGAAGLTAIRTGWSVGAVIRNHRPQDAIGVILALEFVHASGVVVGRATEPLPYCPAEAECLWGSTFTRDVVTDAPGVADPHNVTAVRATAQAADWTDAARSAPFVVVARRADGAVAGRAPPNGVVYVVSLVDGRPHAGALVLTTVTPAFVVPAASLPPVGGEVLRAVFYDEPLPLGE